MTALLLSVLPLALGAAISPVLFGIEVLALTSGKNVRARGWMVAAGATATLGAFSLIGLVIGSSLSHHQDHATLDAAIDLTAAVLLAALALRQLTRHRAPNSKKTVAERLEGASTKAFFVAGIIGMITNFSTLVLFLPAFREITRSHAGLAAQGVALAMLLAITLLPVLAPAGVVTIAGDRAKPTLDAMNGFMTRHTKAITVGIEVVFVIVLVAKGLSKLP